MIVLLFPKTASKVFNGSYLSGTDGPLLINELGHIAGQELGHSGSGGEL